MPLGLGHFFDVHQNGHMFFATNAFGLSIGFDKSRVIPSLYGNDLEPLFIFRSLKTCQRLGYTCFGRVVFLRYGNTVTVIPNRNEHGHLQYACGIHGLQEHAFAGGCIADGSESDLISIYREIGVGMKLRIFAEQLGSIGQTQQSRHLPRGG